ARNLLVAGNVITRLLAFGTDSNPPGPCYNGHSDGIEIFDVADSQFIGNLVYDVRSTAAVFFGNWADSPAEYCRNVRFENNVFLTPESGFVGYLSDADGVVLVNNVFWRGIYGGIVVGKNVTGLDVANNVLHSVNYHHSREPFVPEEHRFRHNLLATTEAQQTPPIVGKDGNFVTGDPGFAGIPAIDGFSDPTAYRQPAAAYPQSEKEASNEAEATEAVSAEPETPRVRLEDFAPKPGSPLLDAGSGAGAPTKDALGRARPRGKGVDIGAFEGALAPAR
ncbi:MAG: right-handed parallel beta-helix repeat-containing protein, partial [Myxococcota bacterium]